MSVLPRVVTALLMLAPVLASPMDAQTRYRFAGGAPSLLQRPARLEIRSAPLATGLVQLQRNSGVALAFSPSLLDDAPAVTCLCRAVTVGEALDRMLAGTSFTYEEMAGQILVEPLPSAVLMLAQAGLGAGASPPVLTPVEATARPAAIAPEPVGTGEDFRPWAARAPAGQATGTVRGSVVESGSDRPLSGAQVYVPGSGHGALTNAAGLYVITGVPVGERQVRAEMLGYATLTKPVTVVADQTAQVNFTMTAAAITLDQVVVTGVPGSATKRTLGNAISTINVADVTNKVTNGNVTQLLQAKAPGVSVLSSSGTPGSAGDIRIRGISSLSASSAPVVYVDGVRIYSGPTGAFRNNWMAPAAGQVSTGGQTSYSLDAINPADIESIEVIKGPAAATLYGADAANGVIQIITKKGKPGQQKLQWNAKLEQGQRAWALDTRTNYTTCTADRVGDPAWGGADGHGGCLGKAVGTVLAEDFLSNALRKGQIQNLALSVRGGGDGYSFFVAGENAADNGVFSNSWDKRSAFRSNFSFYPSEKVDFTINLGYTRAQTRFPSSDNGGSVMSSAWAYQPGRTPNTSAGEQYGFGTETPQALSVYDNRILSDRVTLGTTLNYRPFSWLRNRLVVGGDINSRQANRYVPPNSPFSPVEGQMTQGMPRDNLYSLDYAGTITKSILPELSSALSFGLQYVDRESRNTVAQGTGYPTDAVQNVASAQTRISWDEFLSVKSLGFFGQEQITYKERLYLTGALRVDNSSVFGADVKRLYYPKLSAAYVISDASYFRRYAWLNNLKLRAAWGQAGNAPDPFARTTSYNLQQVVPPCIGESAACVPPGFASGAYLSAMGNPNVKPERGNEIEVGFDAGVLDNRAGLEFTFYNKTTQDALMPVPFIGGPSAGFSGSIWQNVGEINNRGIELAVTATPVQRHLLTWESRLGLATNANKLVKFGYAADTLYYGLTTTNQRTVPGYPLAGYWVHDPVFNSTTNGYDPGPARYLGPSMPTREISFTNTFTIKGNLQVFALLDYKGGNYLLDQTGERLCQIGVCKDVNDPSVSAQRKAMLEAPLSSNDAMFTYKADFIKFRDLSLTYTLPSVLAGRVGADRIALTVAGHNLGFLWKPDYKGLDPEVTFNGVNDPREDGQAFGWVRADYFTVPMTRSLTASLNVTF